MIADLPRSLRIVLLALAAAALPGSPACAEASSASPPGSGARPFARQAGPSLQPDRARRDSHWIRIEIRLQNEENGYRGTVRMPVAPSTDTLRWVRGDLEVEAPRILSPDSVRTSLVETEGDSLSMVLDRIAADTGRTDGKSDTLGAVRDTVGHRSKPDTLLISFRGSVGEVLERARRSGGRTTAIWTPPPTARTSPWFPLPLHADSLGGMDLTIVTDTAYAVAAPGRRARAPQRVAAGEPSLARSRFLMEGPVALDRLGWASGRWTVVTRDRAVSDEEPRVEAYLSPGQASASAEIFDRIHELLPALEAITGSPPPADRLRIAAVSGLHEPGPDPPGLTLVPDSLIGAPLPPLLSSRSYPLARALADQWTVPTLPPGAPDWVRDGWAQYAALRALERRGDSVEATRVLRRAQVRLPARGATAKEEADRSPLANRRARGLWVWMLLDRTRPGAAPARTLEESALRRALRRTGPERPRLQVRYRPAPGGDALLVTIERDTAGARTANSAPPAPFDLTLETGTAGGLRRFDVRVGAPTQSVRLPVSGGADFLVADPANVWPFPVRVEQSASSLLDQLRRASTLEGRIQAARALTRFEEDPALPIGIRGVLEQNPPVLVEHALVRTLGRLPGGGSRDALVRSRLTATHPLVRTAAVTAVARSDSTGIDGSVLVERARADENVYVQAAAVRGAARRRPEGWMSLVRSAFVTDAPNEVIRRSAFEALQIARVPAEDGLEPALAWSTAERDPLLRAAAPSYLVHADERAAARSRLEALLADPDLRVRIAAAEALRGVEASYAEALIADRREEETHPWVRWILGSG